MLVADAHGLGNGDRMEEITRAPEEWRGGYFEDIEVGHVFRSRLGRTITDADNVWSRI
jgi:acyl dehydratase